MALNHVRRIDSLPFCAIRQHALEQEGNAIPGKKRDQGGWKAAQLGYTDRMEKDRIGIFGGTFDPPHVGHLILASEACAQLKLTRLLWMLTPDPPHKQDQEITPLEQRKAMVEYSILGDRSFELSLLEVERPGPHYTLDTVRILRERHPQAEIVLLIGGDSLHDLPTWYRPAELVRACDRSEERRVGKECRSRWSP